MFRIVLPLLLGLAVAPSTYGQTASPESGENRVFELRTYIAAPGQAEALHGRFREHALAMFEKHGMTNIGYWTPAGESEPLIVFLLAYPSEAARKAAWSGVAADPHWLRIRSWTEKKGKLVEAIEEEMLTPTADSPRVRPTRENSGRTFEFRRGDTGDCSGHVVGRWTNASGERVELVARDAPAGVANLLHHGPILIAPVGSVGPGQTRLEPARRLVPTDYSPLR